jgi:hypothetical protein
MTSGTAILELLGDMSKIKSVPILGAISDSVLGFADILDGLNDHNPIQVLNGGGSISSAGFALFAPEALAGPLGWLGIIGTTTEVGLRELGVTSAQLDEISKYELELAVDHELWPGSFSDIRSMLSSDTGSLPAKNGLDLAGNLIIVPGPFESDADLASATALIQRAKAGQLALVSERDELQSTSDQYDEKLRKSAVLPKSQTTLGNSAFNESDYKACSAAYDACVALPGLGFLDCVSRLNASRGGRACGM